MNHSVIEETVSKPKPPVGNRNAIEMSDTFENNEVQFHMVIVYMKKYTKNGGTHLCTFT